MVLPKKQKKPKTPKRIEIRFKTSLLRGLTRCGECEESLLQIDGHYVHGEDVPVEAAIASGYLPTGPPNEDGHYELEDGADMKCPCCADRKDGTRILTVDVDIVAVLGADPRKLQKFIALYATPNETDGPRLEMA